jgi:hypothetical protein
MPRAPKTKTRKKRDYVVGYAKPPLEAQFKLGNTAAVGHGRPRTLSELRELIQAIGAEPLTQDGLTRLEAKLRILFTSKNATDALTILQYGWGKVKEQIEIDDTGLTDDERAKRIALILERARQAGTGQAPSSDSTDDHPTT